MDTNIVIHAVKIGLENKQLKNALKQTVELLLHQSVNEGSCEIFKEGTFTLQPMGEGNKVCLLLSKHKLKIENTENLIKTVKELTGFEKEALLNVAGDYTINDNTLHLKVKRGKKNTLRQLLTDDNIELSTISKYIKQIHLV